VSPYGKLDPIRNETNLLDEILLGAMGGGSELGKRKRWEEGDHSGCKPMTITGPFPMLTPCISI
jgi:hypothetical protein